MTEPENEAESKLVLEWATCQEIVNELCNRPNEQFIVIRLLKDGESPDFCASDSIQVGQCVEVFAEFVSSYFRSRRQS